MTTQQAIAAIAGASYIYLGMLLVIAGFWLATRSLESPVPATTPTSLFAQSIQPPLITSVCREPAESIDPIDEECSRA